MRIGADVKSETTCTNTGAPHGTVLFPFISLYTADCRSHQKNTPTVRFSVVTGLTGLIADHDDSHYRRQISDFADRCVENFLQLNVGKAKVC